MDDALGEEVGDALVGGGLVTKKNLPRGDDVEELRAKLKINIHKLDVHRNFEKLVDDDIFEIVQ